MLDLNLAPLTVSNEAFLVASLIERCPKTMMLRELIVNAIEAASAATEGKALVQVDSTLIHGVAKLRIWNTGPGLSATELDQMCDIASSIRKAVGLDGNFGMGAKVASLPSNQRGVIYRSCTTGRVHQVVMGCQGGVYGRILQSSLNGTTTARVIDVTGEYQGEHDLGHDWTEVVLVGNHDHQDTVRAPYDDAPSVAADWVKTYLTQRFFRLPALVSLELLQGIISPELKIFTSVADRLNEFTRVEGVAAADGTVIHYAHMEGPIGLPGPNAPPVHDLRGIAGIVYRGEIYSLRTGARWPLDAPAFGIPFGARAISVFVELADDAPIRPEAYRQFLRMIDGDQHQITLLDYAPVVRSMMPFWLREIIAAITPRQANYLAEVQDELNSLVAELELPPDEAPPSKPSTQTDAAPPVDRPSDPPRSRFQKPPELIALHDQAQIDDRGLNGRAAQYLPLSRQIYANMVYPGVLQMALDLRKAFTDLPNQERVAELATSVAEWSVLRLVSRAVIFSMAKAKQGWTKDETARAQSAEALTIVADNYQLALPAAQERLLGMLTEANPAVKEVRQADEARLASLRTLQKREVELATLEQTARRSLVADRSPPGPFMRQLSEVALRRNNIPLAIDWARRAVEADPKDPWSRFNLAGVLLSAKELDAAREEASEALRAAGAAPHPALLRQMADVEMTRKDFDAAISWSRKAVEMDATDPWSHFSLSGAAFAAKLLDLAECEAREAIARSAQLVPAAFYARLGEILTQQGDRPAAIKYTAQAIEAENDNLWHHYTLAGLLMASGMIDEAAQAAHQAIVFSGKTVPGPVARRLSEVEMAQRNLTGALEWACKAVDTDPGDPWSQYQLSVALQRSGNVAEASTASEAAIKCAGALVPSELLRRLSEVRVEQGELDEAIGLARRAAETNPQDPWSSLHLARLLMRTHQLDEALFAAKQAMSSAQKINDGSFARTLSEIHMARKETQHALAWARKAVIVNENDEWTQAHLAGLLLSMDDLNGAERAARLALINSSPSAMKYFVHLVHQMEVRRSASAA